MPIRASLLILLASVVLCATAHETPAGDWHVRKGRVLCGVPIQYRYGHDDPRGVDRAVSQPAPPAETVTQAQGLAETSTETVTRTRSEDGAQVTRTRRRTVTRSPQVTSVRRKRFIIRPLETGPVRLQQIGISLYETGRFVLSGRLNHDGGPNGALWGNRVTVRVRALAGPEGENVPADKAPAVWETSRSLWLSRGVPEPFSLRIRGTAALARHFDEITHIEIYLQHRRNR